MSSNGKIRWTEHPLIDLDPIFRRLSDNEAQRLAGKCGGEALVAYVQAREDRITKAVTDPLCFGFDLPHWRVIRHYLRTKEEVFNFGGNDTAKTELLAKVSVEVLYRRLDFPNAAGGPPQVLCIAQNDTMSKRVQQRRIYSYLPVEVRGMNESAVPRKRMATQKLTYSDDGGFTNGSFSIANPRGAALVCRNVTQFERNELSLEGDGYHAIVIDESTPLAFLETLRFRAAKKGGRILYCFTPISGFDAVCNNVFTGARLVAYLPMQWDWTYRKQMGDGRWQMEGSFRADGQFVPKGAEAVAEFLTGGINPEIQFPELDLGKSYAPNCPPGHMPFVMQPLKAEQVIVFSWSHWNPFAPVSKFNPHLPKIADKCVGRGSRISLIRLFGFCEKLAGTLLSNFKAEYYPNGHLIKHAELLELLAKEPHNLRHGVDPATARSWFNLWKAVLKNGLDERPMQYLVWESPNVTEGEWVTPDEGIGDGQRIYGGRDVDFYKIHCREIEAMLARSIYGDKIPAGYVGGLKGSFHPDPVWRAGDPRGFANQTGEGSRYFELFFRDDAAKDARLAPMIFRPASVRSTVSGDVGGEGKLIDLLACDWSKPISAENHPHLIVSDACQNFIKCSLNWDGRKQTIEGKVVNSPYADGVDAARVMFDLELPYQEPDNGENKTGGAWT